jgi:PadR family transcriptional regulator, regulatory protein PadR
MESREISRLRTKTSVELLWPYILSLMRKEPVYAYEIQDAVKRKFGFEVGNVTSYMVLYKLESSGLVRTEWRSVENRQRKYYSITKKGREALDEAIGHFRKTAEKLKK